MKEKQIEEFNSKIDYLQDQLQNREKLVGDEVSYQKFAAVSKN